MVALAIVILVIEIRLKNFCQSCRVTNNFPHYKLFSPKLLANKKNLRTSKNDNVIWSYWLYGIGWHIHGPDCSHINFIEKIELKTVKMCCMMDMNRMLKTVVVMSSPMDVFWLIGRVEHSMSCMKIILSLLCRTRLDVREARCVNIIGTVLVDKQKTIWMDTNRTELMKTRRIGWEMKRMVKRSMIM